MARVAQLLGLQQMKLNFRNSSTLSFISNLLPWIVQTAMVMRAPTYGWMGQVVLAAQNLVWGPATGCSITKLQTTPLSLSLGAGHSDEQKTYVKELI